MFLRFYHEYVCDVPSVSEKTEHTYEQLSGYEEYTIKIV